MRDYRGAPARIVEQLATRRNNRWKAILGMSSDHAGINQELDRFRASMYRTLAELEDPRQVRDWLHFMRSASAGWLTAYKAREGLK